VFTTEPQASSVAGEAFAPPPVVTIQDANGNTVTTATDSVTLTLSGGAGTLSGDTTIAAIAGVATFSGLLIDLIGADYVLTASSDTLVSDVSAAFAITAAAADTLSLAAGNAQSATVNTAVADSLRVLVTDAFGNPVNGTTVTFAIVTGGGTLTDSVAVSGPNGLATLGSWTLGLTAGGNSLTATSDGLDGSPVTFTATATAGNATQLVFTTEPPASTTAGVAFAPAPVVTIQDANGNTVTTATDNVTLTLSTGTGTLSGSTTVAAVAGVATFGGLSIDSIGTDKVLTASSDTLASDSTAAFTIVADTAASLTITQGNGQSAPVNSDVPVPPQVRVLDSFGNPVAGVVVTFTVTSGGGSVTGAAAVSDANGLATVGSWTLGVLPIENTLEATLGSLAPVTFTATATPLDDTQLAMTTAKM
jgi:hypothetical protein